MERALTDDMAVDLLRSSWIVEAARASVYRDWSAHDGRFRTSEKRAARKTDILETALDAAGRVPDQDMVASHAEWMRSLAGEAPGEVAFGDLLLVRFGDWVGSHTGDAVDDGGELLALGAEENAEVVFPAELPPPPPLTPLPIPEVEPPGEVRFRIGILGDLHIGSPRGEAMARSAIADLNASGAELVIQLGDITDHGDKEEFELATRILADLNVPYTTMLGNHDIVSKKEERIAGHEYYPASFGREPDGVLLEHRGVRFAVLDSAEHGASPFAPFDLVSGTFADGPGGAVVSGSLTPPQHDILADIAAPSAGPAFVFLHHPPQPFTSFPPLIFGLREDDTGRLHAACDSGNVWGVFAGHTHRNARSRNFDGVPANEVAIPRDYPFGFALIDVAARGYAYRFVQLSDEDLLRDAAQDAGEIMRRYSEGSGEALAFRWVSPEDGTD